jgi:hypothetical protein
MTEPGCYIDGHWGQYGIARVVQIADEMGRDADDAGWGDLTDVALAERHLASMGPSDSEGLTPDEFELLVDAADRAEAWLNERHASDGNHWYWSDGEFFYGTDDDDDV